MELEEDINGDVGFEEGRVWLPTHVLKEALEPKDSSWPQHRHLHHGHDTSLPADAVSRNHNFFSNPSWKLKSRSRYRANIASGGPGMQAVFLDHSSKKSCGGTGFFLPRNTTATNFSPSKKPACSPVLLPARVIEALNLNVYALGSILTSRQDPNKNHNVRSRNEHRDSWNCKKNGSKGVDHDVKITESCVPLNSFQSSPEEIFLPKDWSY